MSAVPAFPYDDGEDHAPGIEEIDPEIARDILGGNTHNRNVRQSFVRAYAADMTSGDWKWNGESIKIATDGTVIDGQHRLLAVIESGVTVPMLVIRGLPMDVQETVDGGIRRTFADVLKLRGESNWITLAAMVRGICLWDTGSRTFGSGSSQGITNAMLLATLEKRPWVRDGVHTVMRAQSNAGLPARVSGALWYAFTLIDAEDAEYFFDRLCSGEGHAAGDPIFELRKVLTTSRDNVRGERNTRYLAAVTIKAWNKYRDGETVGVLKFRVGGANPEQFPEPR